MLLPNLIFLSQGLGWVCLCVGVCLCVVVCVCMCVCVCVCHCVVVYMSNGQLKCVHALHTCKGMCGVFLSMRARVCVCVCVCVWLCVMTQPLKSILMWFFLLLCLCGHSVTCPIVPLSALAMIYNPFSTLQKPGQNINYRIKIPDKLGVRYTTIKLPFPPCCSEIITTRADLFCTIKVVAYYSHRSSEQRHILYEDHRRVFKETILKTNSALRANDESFSVSPEWLFLYVVDIQSGGVKCSK